MGETINESTALGISLDKRVELLEFSNKAHSDTHKEIFDRLRKLEINDATQIEQYKSIIKELAGLSLSIHTLTEKLSEVESKPAKRWEGIVDKTIWTVIGGVVIILIAAVAFIAGKVGIG